MTRIEQLLAFYKEDPSDSFVAYSIAQEFLKAGNLTDAISYFVSLKENDPSYVGLYFHLGKTYEKAGDLTNARQAYVDGIAQAREAKDNHAASELQGALALLDESD